MQAQSNKAYLDRTQTKIAVHVIKCRRFSCESLWSWALLAGKAGVFCPFCCAIDLDFQTDRELARVKIWLQGRDC